MEKRENNNLIQQEGQFVAQNSEKGEISALEVAKYLLSLDPQRQYFTLERITRQEGWEDLPRKGNFRLNKMLHMCQIFHCVKYGKPLFKERMEAFEHGAIVYKVHENFKELYNSLREFVIDLISEKKEFIEKIYYYFKEFDDLILRNFSHDDPAWKLGKEDENGLMPLDKKLIDYYAKFFDDTLAEIEEK